MNLVIPGLRECHSQGFFLTLTVGGMLMGYWDGMLHETRIEGGELFVTKLSEQRQDGDSLDNSYYVWLMDDGGRLYRVDIEFGLESESFAIVCLICDVVDFTNIGRSLMVWNEQTALFKIDSSVGFQEYRVSVVKPVDVTKYWYIGHVSDWRGYVIFSTSEITYATLAYEAKYSSVDKILILNEPIESCTVEFRSVIIRTREGNMYFPRRGSGLETLEFPWPVSGTANTRHTQVEFALTTDGELFWTRTSLSDWSLLLEGVSSFLVRENVNELLVIAQTSSKTLILLTCPTTNPGSWRRTEVTSPLSMSLVGHFAHRQIKSACSV